MHTVITLQGDPGNATLPNDPAQSSSNGRKGSVWPLQPSESFDSGGLGMKEHDSVVRLQLQMFITLKGRPDTCLCRTPQRNAAKG